MLTALQQGLFEPLQTVEPKFQRKRKILLLLALASIKRVGTCTHFGRRFVPRVWTGGFPDNPEAPARLCAQGSHYSLQSQVVSLQALPLEEADPALALLCPVRALRCYVDRKQSFRTSDQLFVCHGGRQKGNAISKQRMAHWTVVAITLAYQAMLVAPRWQIFVELRAGRPLTCLLDSIAFVWNRFPPVCSPQTSRSTEGLRF